MILGKPASILADPDRPTYHTARLMRSTPLAMLAREVAGCAWLRAVNGCFAGV
jgi:hypothetical protein